MDYIYDIVLNFHDDYYDFYEWKSSDKIINVKRIPIYKIDTKDYLNIKNNIVTINRNTIPKTNKMFLLTNGIEVMGIIIDNQGKVIKKSSLIFEESDEILEEKDIFKVINLKYIVNKYNKDKFISRILKEKINYIDLSLNNLDKERDKYILKYLYYDIYNEDSDDIDNIYQKLITLSKENISMMYESLKRVNLELKR
ncbi:MAG: hypothetical protein IJZ79_04240 [Bacilli bacterium]|nr:hypothetical protein [Bacilli bacterium]